MKKEEVMIMEINAGYEIIESITFPKPRGVVLGYVVGKMPNKESYVTWMKNIRGYDQGHYGFSSFDEAVMDMMDRAYGDKFQSYYVEKILEQTGIQNMIEEYGVRDTTIENILGSDKYMDALKEKFEELLEYVIDEEEKKLLSSKEMEK